MIGSEQERPLWRPPALRRRLLTLGLVALVVAAAAVLVVTIVRRPLPAPTVSGPVLTTADTGRGSSLVGVGLGGRLTERAGCLLLAGRPVYWRRGTRWDPVRRTVVLDDGRRRPVGRRFSGGGEVVAASVAAARLDRTAGARLLRCVRVTGSTEAVRVDEADR